jgi:iron complex outermembrane receptor protein
LYQIIKIITKQERINKMKILKLLLVIPVFSLQFGLMSASDARDKHEDTLDVNTNEIVVTATKIPEKILEVPLAVSVIPRQELINRRGYGLDEVLGRTPGVLAQSRYGGQDIRITIRGFGARGAGDRSNAGTSRGIKVFMDGIPETEPDGRTSFDNIDISMANRIEVIRSNSSSLWGNAAGGVVSITSMPAFSSPFLRLSAQSGSYGYNKFVVESGTPLGGGRLSAALSGTKFDGYRQNSSAERYLANFAILTPVSESTLLGVYLLASSNRFNVPGP